MRNSEAPLFLIAHEATRTLRPFMRRQLIPTIEDETIFYRPDTRHLDHLRSATDVAITARLLGGRGGMPSLYSKDGSGGVASAEQLAKLGAMVGGAGRSGQQSGHGARRTPPLVSQLRAGPPGLGAFPLGPTPQPVRDPGQPLPPRDS